MEDLQQHFQCYENSTKLSKLKHKRGKINVNVILIQRLLTTNNYILIIHGCAEIPDVF